MKRLVRPTRPIALALGLALGALTACQDAELEARADATCEAVNAQRFEEAIRLSEGPAALSMSGRQMAECRCIAFLSQGDRSSCVEELGPLLASTGAQDWVPHPLLTKMMLRTWQAQGEIESAAVLATRAARLHRDDLELLQLELRLRSQVEDEDRVLAEVEARLEEDPDSIPQRVILAQSWLARSGHEHALRVLGDQVPAKTHPLALPWHESRVQAQAAAGDLAAVQQSFAQWRASGWDPVDLEARYALRLSVGQLVDPLHPKIDLLRAAIANQERLRDRQLVWGLHRRLISELLSAGRPAEALAAYDAAIEVVELAAITREQIERALRRTHDTASSEAAARLRFHVPEVAVGGTLLVSPEPGAAPDSGYRRLPVGPDSRVVVESALGLHPLRYVLEDAEGRTRASGAIWPEPGATQDIELHAQAAARKRERPSATRPKADGRRRVFVILPDCGDWRLTEYLRARGELPFFDHLFEEGYYAVLESRPAFTAAALQSLVWPGRAAHPGTLGWLHHLGLELAGLESVGRNPVDWLASLLPARPNLFETLGAGPLVTANMLLAHGRIEAGRHAEIIGPEGQRDSLPSQKAHRSLDPEEIARHPDLLHDAATRRFAETIAAEMDAADEIAIRGEVDFLFLRLEALDLITHGHFGPLDGVGQDDARGPLLATYRYIDDRLADLHARLDADDWLVVLSDHGIRSSMQHEEDAIFAVLGAGVPAGRAPAMPHLRGVPRSLAAMLQIDTEWPETGTMPWLHAEPAGREIAAHP